MCVFCHRINCTVVELKLGYTELDHQYNKVLIVPLWN